MRQLHPQFDTPQGQRSPRQVLRSPSPARPIAAFSMRSVESCHWRTSIGGSRCAEPRHAWGWYWFDHKDRWYDSKANCCACNAECEAQAGGVGSLEMSRWYGILSRASLQDGEFQIGYL
jgi:hypothetical protein